MCSCVSRNVKLTKVVVMKNKKEVCNKIVILWTNNRAREDNEDIENIEEEEEVALAAAVRPFSSIDNSITTRLRGFKTKPEGMVPNNQFIMTVSGPTTFHNNRCRNGSPKQCPSVAWRTTY
jgi:hypothetical protein